MTPDRSRGAPRLRSFIYQDLRYAARLDEVGVRVYDQGPGGCLMRIVVGSDHAGFELKKKIVSLLFEEGNLEVVDVGSYNTDPVDYPDYAEAVGLAIRERRAERGILICGSGVGASVAANKFPGIRGGVCYGTYSARQGGGGGEMNGLTVGGARL